MYEPSFAVAPSRTHLDSPFPDRSAQSAQVIRRWSWTKASS